MKPDTITCSFVMDRDTYNRFRSIVGKRGQTVEDSIVSYMQSVIRNDADTAAAVRETEDLEKDPAKKVYGSFSEVLDELTDDE